MEEEKPIVEPEQNKLKQDQLKTDELDRFRDYLIGLRNHYGPYHERKEQIAWAAITIYMTAIFAITLSVVSNFDKIGIPSLSKVAFIILLLLTSVLLLIFLRNEFENRRFAAEMVRVVGELLAKLSYPEFDISVEEMECKKYQSYINGEKYIFPKIFCDHLDQKKVGDCEFYNREEPRKRKFTSYEIFKSIIVIWTLSISIIIWFLPS